MTVAIQFNVDQALAKLGELVQQHGPQAVETAAHVVQVDAMGTIVRGVGLMALGAASAAGAVVCFKRASDGDPCSFADALLAPMLSFVFGIVAPLVLVMGLLNVIDVWSWVAIFDPKLALAHEIMQRLGAQ